MRARSASRWRLHRLVVVRGSVVEILPVDHLLLSRRLLVPVPGRFPLGVRFRAIATVGGRLTASFRSFRLREGDEGVEEFSRSVDVRSRSPVAFARSRSRSRVDGRTGASFASASAFALRFGGMTR